MVNVPFVSEEFQRAFRNTFQGQVNSGRDLHVSDIVIPVVDFTPTASGTSLPESLRYALNRNTTHFSGGAPIASTSVNVSNGFYRIKANLNGNSGQQNLSFLLTNSAATIEVEVLFLDGTTSSTGTGTTRDFIVYQTVGDDIRYSFDEFSGNGTYTFSVTPFA